MLYIIVLYFFVLYSSCCNCFISVFYKNISCVTKKDYPIYEEVVISFLADNHNPSNIPFFFNQ